MAARRLGKRELSQGWSTWLELWEIKSRQMRQMRAVQARYTPLACHPPYHP